MKRKYVTLELDVIEYSVDVITASTPEGLLDDFVTPVEGRDFY